MVAPLQLPLAQHTLGDVNVAAEHPGDLALVVVQWLLDDSQPVTSLRAQTLVVRYERPPGFHDPHLFLVVTLGILGRKHVVVRHAKQLIRGQPQELAQALVDHAEDRFSIFDHDPGSGSNPDGAKQAPLGIQLGLDLARSASSRCTAS